MNLDSPFQTTTFKNLGEGQFGVGVAAGNFGGAAASDFVATSANTLHVFVDGQPNNDSTYVSAGPTDPCPIDLSAGLPTLDRTNRALIVDTLGTSSMKIAVGTPVATASGGHVAIFDFDATTGAFSCAALLTGTEAHFGRAMTLVDTDGTGGPDALLVGAPPTHAYLYTLPLASGQAPVAMATDTMGGGSFGAAVAAFDVDGKAGDEIFVGNPDATVDGKTTAGNVSIYKYSGSGTALPLLTPTTYPNPLAEHDPEAGHGYGSGVDRHALLSRRRRRRRRSAGAPTTDAGAVPCTDMPLVGSFAKVFAYYTINSRHTDARAR